MVRREMLEKSASIQAEEQSTTRSEKAKLQAQVKEVRVGAARMLHRGRVQLLIHHWRYFCIRLKTTQPHSQRNSASSTSRRVSA